jgi:hypothetical protein
MPGQRRTWKAAKFTFGLAFPRHFAPFGGFFAFALHAWLLEMFAPAGLSENAFLLNLATKAPQGCLKRLIFANSDLCHQESPPYAQYPQLAVSSADRPPLRNMQNLAAIWMIEPRS